MTNDERRRTKPSPFDVRRSSFVVVFLALFSAARLVALPEPLGVDQGIFATAGWGLSHGLALYRDVWDQKPPGIHLLYYVAFEFFGTRPATVLLLDTIAAAAVCALVFAIAHRLHSVRAGWCSALVFAVATYPAFERYYGGFLERAVPETFILALATGAAYAVVTGRYGVMGLLLGAAAVFKPTAVIYWPVFLLFVLLTDRADIVRAVVRSTATACIAPAFVMLWLWREHVLAEAWTAIVVYNRAYVAAGSGWLALPDRLAHEVWRLVKTDPLWFVGAAGMVLSLAGLKTRPTTVASGVSRTIASGALPPLQMLAILWLAAVVCAVAANGIRMYATYFLPAGAPLALLGGALLADHPLTRESARRAWWRPALAAAVLVAAAAIAVRAHGFDRLLRFGRADLTQLRGGADRGAYLELFGGYANGRGYSARANQELSDYLASRTSAADRVYIFGMAPSVYFMSTRLPANRFVWTYPGVVPLAGRSDFTPDALARDLERASPAYLVLERNNRDSASGWRIEDVYAAPAIRALLDRYVAEKTVEDFTIMRRR